MFRHVCMPPFIQWPLDTKLSMLTSRLEANCPLTPAHLHVIETRRVPSGRKAPCLISCCHNHLASFVTSCRQSGFSKTSSVRRSVPTPREYVMYALRHMLRLHRNGPLM